MLKRWSAGVAALSCRILLLLLPGGVRRQQGLVLGLLLKRSLLGATKGGPVVFLQVWGLATLDLLLCVAARTSPIQHRMPRWSAFRAAPATPQGTGFLAEAGHRQAKNGRGASRPAAAVHL